MSHPEEPRERLDRREVIAGAAVLGTMALRVNAAAAHRNDSYDVVIVGGGSAGSVLANRLSADPTRRVLLIEAGRAYAPGGYPDALRLETMIGGDAAHEWGYASEPFGDGRSIRLPRGKVLGGCSAMNAGVAMRAPAEDFERWTRTGLRGWTPADVLPFYKRSERTAAGEEGFHGRDGPWPIHQMGEDELSDMQRAFVASCQAAGFWRTADFNGADPYGVSPLPVNNRSGIRLSTGMTYLSAAVRARHNLTILSETLVDRIEIEGGRATAVRLADGHRIAGGEIVVSAGAYNSPTVLMRSGIGPANELGEFGIPVVMDLPVGRGLQGHPLYVMAFAAHPERLGLPYPPAGAMLVARSKSAEGFDRDLQVSAVHHDGPADPAIGAILKMAIANVRPRSRGSVKLRDRDPRTPPRIRLDLLADQIDRDRLVDGVELVRRIVATAPLCDMIARELTPGVGAYDRAAIARAIPATLSQCDHPSSTVPMGADDDPAAVVDAEGRVRGVTGLRVVDASIFPEVPSTAINSTVIMAAEKLSDSISRG